MILCLIRRTSCFTKALRPRRISLSFFLSLAITLFLYIFPLLLPTYDAMWFRWYESYLVGQMLGIFIDYH